MIDKLAIVATVGVGVAIGLLCPTHRAMAPSHERGMVDVVLQRSGDHHYYADASVNGHSVHFLIDTGAAETALTEDDAKAIGLDIDPTKYEVIGDGASGIVRGEYAQLKSIDLQGIRQPNPRVVVVAGATVSLLGQPFLENVDEITIRKGEMRLSSQQGS